MATTISCVIYGADIRGMQVTLRCRGYSPTTFKGYGYVDDAGQIGHDLWQFRGSRSSAGMGFLEEDESRIWVMAFDTGSSYPVTNNYSASEFEDGVKKICWPAIEINFTFRKGDQVLISLQLGQQSYTCSCTLKNALQPRNRAATHPSSTSRDSATRRSYQAAIQTSSEPAGKQDRRFRQSLPPARLAKSSPPVDEERSIFSPRQYGMVSMPSCSKNTAERTDRLEQHKDKLKVLPIATDVQAALILKQDWLYDDKAGKYQKIREQKTFPLPLSTRSREIESAEILLKLSRVPVLPAQQAPCSLEMEGGTPSPRASLDGHSSQHGTSSTDIMIWVEQVSEFHVEEPCPVVPEVSLLTRPPSAHLTEINWAGEEEICDEDTIVVDVRETNRSRRNRLSKICEGT